MAKNYFLEMIRGLRKQEEIVLYGNILEITPSDAIETGFFLEQEYQQEALDYPHTPPAYHDEAALWAAKTLYVTSQLILYRKNEDSDLLAQLPDFQEEITPEMILSADLCLRFLPELLPYLKQINAEDPLVQIIEDKLVQWHYSGIGYNISPTLLHFEQIASDPCLQQLYTDRIISLKNLQLAKHAPCTSWVMSSLGIFAKEFWPELKTAISLHE